MGDAEAKCFVWLATGLQISCYRIVDGGCALWESEFHIYQKSQPFRADGLYGKGVLDDLSTRLKIVTCQNIADVRMFVVWIKHFVRDILLCVLFLFWEYQQERSNVSLLGVNISIFCWPLWKYIYVFFMFIYKHVSIKKYWCLHVRMYVYLRDRLVCPWDFIILFIGYNLSLSLNIILCMLINLDN